jgi:hypothetical protein
LDSSFEVQILKNCLESEGMPAIRSRLLVSKTPVWLRWTVSVIGGLTLLVFAASWWFTAPLDKVDASEDLVRASSDHKSAAHAAKKPLVWPEGTVEGVEAKEFLHELVKVASERIDAMKGYTATFKKQERLRGVLTPENTLSMKVRHEPFAIYVKFLAPKAGKEVLFAKGKHDNKVLAHNGDWTRRLIPRLAIDPDSSLALADSRHPITDAGLQSLARRLVNFRKLDLEDAEARTILDKFTDESGRVWPRSVHLHVHKSESRPFTRVEVLYDPTTLLPIQISSFDWPEPGQKGELLLAERYRYENLQFDPPLAAIDFEPSNPAYGFQRF